MKTFKTTKTGFNSRIRKEKEIMAFILDSKGTLIDAIIPGSGNHRTALDWAEWRATSIMTDYPAAVRMVIHVGDVEIAVLEIDETDDTQTKEVAAAATESATESSELTHAGQCLEIYLDNTREIYDRYTVNAIERVKRAIKAGEYVGDNAGKLVNDIQEITPALQAAALLVKRYDHLTPTPQDIQQVTRNYAAYIVDCAKYEVENVKH